MFEWSRNEIERIGASNAMELYKIHPVIMDTFMEFIRTTVDPTKTTDTYMAVRMAAYIQGYLDNEVSKVDIDYAIKQLRPILEKPDMGFHQKQDRVQRALDALERESENDN